MTLVGCKLVLIHIPPHVFDKCYDSTFVINSSPVTLKFRGHRNSQPHADGFLVLWLYEIEGVHIKSYRHANIEIYYKTWNYTDSSCRSYLRHCRQKSPACNALTSAKVSAFKTVNSNKSFFPLLSCVVCPVCRGLFTTLFLANPIWRQFLVMRVSFKRHLWFFYQLVNPRTKKVDVTNRKFWNIFTVTETVRAVLF